MRFVAAGEPCSGAAIVRASRATGLRTLNTTSTNSLLGGLLLLCAACGPETATTTETTGSTSEPEPSGSSTGDASTTSTGEGPTTGTSEAPTTGVDTSTTGTTGEPVCVEFESTDHTEDELPVQFTCGNDEVLCAGVMGLALFDVIDGNPEEAETVTTENLERVHCVLEALRDRQPGQIEWELGYEILGWDRGTIEIAGEFVIVRRNRVNDFNRDYTERALWLEPAAKFAECREMNTANVAWGCIKPYLVGFPEVLECVPEPLTCG